MAGRDPYVAIKAAGEAGSGIALTAEEARILSLDDAIATRAENALNEDGRDMVHRFGWSHLRYIKRNIRATKERAMRGLARRAPTPALNREEADRHG